MAERFYTGPHTGRVRLPNGRMMQLRAYLETLAELYPEPLPEPDLDIEDRLTALTETVDGVAKRINRREALERAKTDRKSGRIETERGRTFHPIEEIGGGGG